MNKKSGFFFHYGPGGSCCAERHFLATDFPNLIFWDQPATSSFSRLVEASCEAYLEESRKTAIQYLVGHSFGCDLALAVADRLKLNSHIILCAPVFDLKNAFVSLSRCVLSQKDAGSDLKENILRKQNLFLQSPESLNLLWDLVFTTYQYSKIQSLFWANTEKFDAFASAAPTFKAFDLQSWQRTLGDYLQLGSKPNFKSTVAQFTGPISILLGAKDPYRDAAHLHQSSSAPPKDEKSIKKAVSQQSAHYPHIEDSALFRAMF